LNTEKNLRLDINYPSYNLLQDEVFPNKINIKARNSKSLTAIDLVYKNVIFNTDVTMHFKIPNGYKRLQF
jgi:hypothetical protein